MTSRVEVKVTIAKLVEVAYSKNKGITTKIVRGKGNFKITVDESGQVTLHGRAGMLTFSGDPVLSELGAKLKNASISFTKGDSDSVDYAASFTFHEAANISLTGSFSVDELLTSCSGMLCQAAKLLKGRNHAYEMELQKIMGY